MSVDKQKVMQQLKRLNPDLYKQPEQTTLTKSESVYKRLLNNKPPKYKQVELIKAANITDLMTLLKNFKDVEFTQISKSLVEFVCDGTPFKITNPALIKQIFDEANTNSLF